MGRRSILILVMVLVAGGGAVWLVRATRQAHRPLNVVLISIDTCRADYLGCYGQSRPTTPTLDLVARGGILFSNVISPMPLTLPAHCSMLTGTIPPFHGVHDNTNYQLGEASVTLAERLIDHGYETAAVIGAAVLHARSGINQGFDIFDDDIVAGPGSRGGRLERRGEEVTRIAKAWLNTHPTNPFFLFIHYYDPHYPYLPPDPFASRFASDLYAGEIAYTDHSIGDLLDELKRLGLYDSSLIIIVGDHGEGLGEHGEAEHGYFIYHSTTKVPLIVRFPGCKPGVRVEQTVSLADIVPTVLGQLSLPAPGDVQGEDLSPFLSGEATTREEPRFIYSESMVATEYGCSPLLGVETSEWKYIQTTEPELYHLVTDPDEVRNLVRERPEHARQLKESLAAILAEHSFRDPDAGKTSLDPERLEQLRALGYTGGASEISFEFDADKEDPKGLIEIHSMLEEVVRHMNGGDLATARRLGESVLAVRPDIIRARRKLAQITIEQGEADLAISHYNELLTLDPLCADAALWHSNLVALLLEKGLLDEAAEHGYEALRLLDRPNEGAMAEGRARTATLGTEYLVYSVHLNLGQTLLRKGMYREALSEVQEALRINPLAAVAHYLHGMVLMELGRITEAAEAYKEALRLQPGHAGALRNLRVIQDGKERP